MTAGHRDGPGKTEMLREAAFAVALLLEKGERTFVEIVKETGESVATARRAVGELREAGVCHCRRLRTKTGSDATWVKVQDAPVPLHLWPRSILEAAVGHLMRGAVSKSVTLMIEAMGATVSRHGRTGNWTATLRDRADRKTVAACYDKSTLAEAVVGLYGQWRELGSPPFVALSPEEIRAIDEWLDKGLSTDFAPYPLPLSEVRHDH